MFMHDVSKKNKKTLCLVFSIRRDDKNQHDKASCFFFFFGPFARGESVLGHFIRLCCSLSFLLFFCSPLLIARIAEAFFFIPAVCCVKEKENTKTEGKPCLSALFFSRTLCRQRHEVNRGSFSSFYLYCFHHPCCSFFSPSFRLLH